MSEKRKPDFQVAALSRLTEHKGNVGAAWQNPDGSISVVLNPFVVLRAEQQLLITLFPNNGNKKKPKAVQIPIDSDDEPPF